MRFTNDCIARQSALQNIVEILVIPIGEKKKFDFLSHLIKLAIFGI